MHAEPAAAETRNLQLPHDLVSALNSHPPRPTTDYRIEALKPSFFGRLLEKLIARKN